MASKVHRLATDSSNFYDPSRKQQKEMLAEILRAVRKKHPAAYVPRGSHRPGIEIPVPRKPNRHGIVHFTVFNITID